MNIISVSIVKDLEEIFSPDLSFNKHKDFICVKFIIILSLINFNNTTNFFDICTFYTLYTQYVVGMVSS